MWQETEDIKRQLEDLKWVTATKKELTKTKNDFAKKIEPKVELSEVQSALNSLQSELASKLFDIHKELKHKISKTEEALSREVERKADMSALNDTLTGKTDTQTVKIWVDGKANSSELETIKHQMKSIQKELTQKANARDLSTHAEYLKVSMEDLNKQVLMKANMKDVVTIADQKTNRDDFESSLQSIQAELMEWLSSKELHAALDEQALINEALCAENCLGRWIWKSSKLKSSTLVPWEIQAVNTCPDNFLWEKNQTSVIAVAPGLYEIALGFYAKTKPTVQIHVNGEPVLSCSNES